MVAVPSRNTPSRKRTRDAAVAACTLGNRRQSTCGCKLVTMSMNRITKPYKVLICDDQPDVLEALLLLFKGQGWQAVTADSPAALLRTSRGGEFDLILTDLNYTRDTTS